MTKGEGQMETTTKQRCSMCSNLAQTGTLCDYCRSRLTPRKKGSGVFTDTGRTALFAGGRSETVYETWTVGGPFDGATFEVLESELPTGRRFKCWGCGSLFYDGVSAGEHDCGSARVEWDQ